MKAAIRAEVELKSKLEGVTLGVASLIAMMLVYTDESLEVS